MAADHAYINRSITLPTETFADPATLPIPVARRPVLPLAVMVPAYNEAASIGDTILSLQRPNPPACGDDRDRRLLD